MSRKDHPSADAVYRTLKDEHPTLSFNTIYMNLMSFAEKGVILKINVLHESARFDGDSSPHHHFVCVRCKKIVDLHNFRMPKITIPKELGAATIFHHQLRLKGICEKCEGKVLFQTVNRGRRREFLSMHNTKVNSSQRIA